jgi:hypothetical protein
MRRYKSSKQSQGEKYLRDRNLLVLSSTLQLTESIKRKARRTQVREDARRALRAQFPPVPRDQSTQTDDDHLTLLEDDGSDTSTEDLIFVPIDTNYRTNYFVLPQSFTYVRECHCYLYPHRLLLKRIPLILSVITLSMS